MNEAPSEPIKPTDPDMLWTGWALHMVREAAEIDMRSKRMTERQQETADRDSSVEFGLIQSRLSRSLRLSVALAERIRTEYLMRRDGREASGEQQRRRQKREQAVDSVVKAIATPADGDGDYLRSVLWKRLVEDEILDAQLDSLSEEAFVQAVCRKIGRPPPSIPLPQGCGEVEAVDAPQAKPAEAADREPAEDRASAPDDPGTGRPVPPPSKPDSS
ncbi:hypothetical protein [Inquilinus limosus]|uniref:Uncharacterized protein n=1 Tax=Inquilinus limosus TaxID=171674 RepID=A0A211ZIG3_9PROT|nr:hypothetical protein [Inquilinus limosus]OWJ65075.1 hypothetical protein BWR60_21555 [Inquilinus limosus]